MNNEFYLIAILICLILLLFSFLMSVIIIKRKVISRWWRRSEVWKFIINIAMPFLIPILMAFLPLFFNDSQKTNEEYGGNSINLLIAINIMFVILAVINVIFQMIIWIREKKDSDIRWENSAARSAYNNMFKILMDKNTRLRGSYHQGLKHGMLVDETIPYDIFSQIRTICWEFCNTIGEITHIDKKDLSAAFVYRYSYKDANEKDRSWRWITGKGSKFNIPLTDFTEQSGSSFRYMIHNSVSTLFYNSKKEAANNGQYLFSYRDDSHKKRGSFLAAKVAFSGNDDVCCEGIIMVHSYGHKFLDKLPRVTEEDLEKLIFDSIFPCYRHLLQTELAMLYFRHETEEINKDRTTCDLNTQLIEDITPCKKTIYCTKNINRKNWCMLKSEQEGSSIEEICDLPLKP